MQTFRENDENVFMNGRIDGLNQEHLFENSISSDFDHLNVIGNGAYGTVYKARERATGNFVALKRIRISITEDGVPLSAVREITALRHLHYHDHPNIVKLMDICQGRFRDACLILFLVFEHIDQNLAEYIGQSRTKGNLEFQRVKNFSKQLLTGVDFLHRHRIIHRDLKPQNILVSDSGQLKIADFGLAKIYDFEMRLTSVVQTLWYRAPEVILGLSYTTAIDIWASGCIIAEMFLKKPLFCGTSEVDQLDRIFRVIGTPEDWPENVSLDKGVFFDYPTMPLRSLIKELNADFSDLLTFVMNRFWTTFLEKVEQLVLYSTMSMLSFYPKNRTNAKNALVRPLFSSSSDEKNS